jgi:hypothetical protein
VQLWREVIARLAAEPAALPEPNPRWGVDRVIDEAPTPSFADIPNFDTLLPTALRFFTVRGRPVAFSRLSPRTTSQRLIFG